MSSQEHSQRVEAVAAARERRRQPRANEIHLIRFDHVDRILHVLLMASFLLLAATGLPLLFSSERWAFLMVRFFGGFEAARLLHRMSAILMIVVFLFHLVRLGKRLLMKKDYGILWGPRSMVPQPRDLAELFGHIRWFLGLGERPRFGRWTYWEKFDYWAVFWGMAIIGGSGLVLWYPETFTKLLPGWALNVAAVVHGEEALLAVVFIFTVHFFNSHLRPEKFPMDMVIFTGRVSESELRHERPAEADLIEQDGDFASLDAGPPDLVVGRAGRIVGTIGVVTGLLLAAFIFYAVIA